MGFFVLFMSFYLFPQILYLTYELIESDEGIDWYTCVSYYISFMYNLSSFIVTAYRHVLLGLDLILEKLMDGTFP